MHGANITKTYEGYEFMKDFNDLSAINYLRMVYGGEIYCRNGEYHILFGKDKFGVKPSLNNKTYSFCLYKDGTYECKFVDSSLVRGLFVICNYPIYKETGVEPTIEDWYKFISDAKKYGGVYERQSF